MLYLNFPKKVFICLVTPFNFNKCCIWILYLLKAFYFSHYLTLTSVVFELICLDESDKEFLDLTLTSVVFELCLRKSELCIGKKFNFNKCCIWIAYYFVLGN